jgi:hypothetical protein
MVMSSIESRITKLEEQLDTPACVCGDRRERFVLLNEIDGPSPELAIIERECFWDCPAHGPSQVRIILRMCLSRAGQDRRNRSLAVTAPCNC